MKMKSLQHRPGRVLTCVMVAAAGWTVAGCASAPPRDSSARVLTPTVTRVAADDPALTPATGPAVASADATDGGSTPPPPDQTDSIIGLSSDTGGALSGGRNGGGGFFGAVAGGPTKLWNFITGKPTVSPSAAVAKMQDRQFPDERREGIATLVRWDFGKRDPYTERYDQIARKDPDPLVRATAIRALNRARHAESDSTFVSALSDPDPQVRLEAAKALNRLPTADAAGPLAKLLSDQQQPRDVRIAASEALGHYQTLDAARALVAQLNGRDFGVAWQARRSLRQMLGADFRYDEPAWLAYLTGPTSPVG